MDRGIQDCSKVFMVIALWVGNYSEVTCIHKIVGWSNQNLTTLVSIPMFSLSRSMMKPFRVVYDHSELLWGLQGGCIMVQPLPKKRCMSLKPLFSVLIVRDWCLYLCFHDILYCADMSCNTVWPPSKLHMSLNNTVYVNTTITFSLILIWFMSIPMFYGKGIW